MRATLAVDSWNPSRSALWLQKREVSAGPRAELVRAQVLPGGPRWTPVLAES